MPDVLGTRLTVYLTEDDRAGRRSLYEVLLERAREDGMAGASIWRGIEGFGASGRLRTSRFPDAASGLPIAVEVIDVPERVEAFLAAVHHLAPGSLVTREAVRIRRGDPATGARAPSS
jgi:PII-like signaling protein